MTGYRPSLSSGYCYQNAVLLHTDLQDCLNSLKHTLLLDKVQILL